MDFSLRPQPSPEQLYQEIQQIIDTHYSELYTTENLKRIISLIDLTTLEGSDSEKRIEEICNKAQSIHHLGDGYPNVAAVCFYPTFAAKAKSFLKDSDVKLACVAGAFPSGHSPLELRYEEVNYTREKGADEIDMVITRGRFLAGDYEFVKHEIEMLKIASQHLKLKVILETGELETAENIDLASRIAIRGGANFIKTSTGKSAVSATLPAFYTMLKVIKEYHGQFGWKIGIKAAGGIRDAKTAIQYLCLVKEVLGEEWMQKDLFRIGASSLLDNVITEIKKLN